MLTSPTDVQNVSYADLIMERYESTFCKLRGYTADRREFLKISQAVGVGFVVMGAIGYVVKLSWWPLIYGSF